MPNPRFFDPAELSLGPDGRIVPSADLLAKFAKLSFGSTTSVLVLIPFLGAEDAMTLSLIATGVFWVLFGWVWWAATHGQEKVGAHVCLWGWWLTTMFVLSLSEDLAILSMFSAVNLIVVAGFLMGQKTALWVGLSAILAWVGFVFLRVFLWFPRHIIEITEDVRIVTLCASMVLSIGLVYTGLAHLAKVIGLARDGLNRYHDSMLALGSAREADGRRAHRAERLGVMARSLVELRDVEAILQEVTVSLRDALDVPLVLVLGRGGEVLSIAGLGKRDPPGAILQERVERMVPLGGSVVLDTDILEQISAGLAIEAGSFGLAARGPNTGLTILAISGVEGTLVAGEGDWSMRAAVYTMDVSIMRCESERRFVQSQQMDALGRLSAGIAHDFNNLLTTIMGCTELVEHSVSSSDPIHGHLRRIRDAGERAEGLTSKLMTFTHGAPRSRQVVELGDFVANLVPIFRRTIEETLQLECHEFESDAWVEIVPVDLERVLFNLVANARDAVGEHGRIDIGIEVRHGSATDGDSPGVVVIWVQDNGEGMDSETRSRMFEPFFTMRKDKGATGLGLSIVASVVQAIGGDVFIDSAKDTGTCVEVHLPQAKTPEVHTPPIAVVASSTGHSILVVEDDSEVRETLCEMLGLLGHGVVSVATGIEALEKLQTEEQFAMVLSDVVMPEMGGFELVSAMNSASIKVPIVLISGYAPGEAVLQGDAPDIPRLSKPFTLGQLQSVMARNILV